MTTVLLVIHLLLAAALVGLVLIQRSEGGGLGIGNSGGFMTTRGTANLLTRMTGIIAGAFMATSLALAIIASHGRGPARSILDGASSLPASSLPSPASSLPSPSAPVSTPSTSAPAVPATPAAPSVPLSK